MQKQLSPWYFCAAGTVLLFCTVGLSTSCFPVLQPYLISVIGLSNSESSLFITVRTLSALVATIFLNNYLRRTGLIRGILLASCTTVAGFLVLAYAGSFSAACASAVLFGIGYSFSGIVAVSILIHNAFSAHLGLALSICAAGTGLSAVVCPPVVTWLVESSSLRVASLAEAAFVLLCIIIVAFILRRFPPEKSSVSGAVRGAARSKPDRACALSLAAMFFLGTIANAGWSHLGVLYRTAGFSSAQVALLMSFVGAALTAGKLIFGECGDILGAKRTISMACILMSIGTLLCCFAESRSMAAALASMLLFGLSLPIASVGLGLIGQSFSASTDFDSFVRSLQVSYTIGTLLFSPIPGIIADISGSYTPAFCILTVFALVCTVLLRLAYRDAAR